MDRELPLCDLEILAPWRVCGREREREGGREAEREGRESVRGGESRRGWGRGIGVR